MPKTDPRTGCTVSTYFEALQNIGASSDPPKDAAEVQQEINEMFDDDDRRTTDNYRNNTIEILQECVQQYNDPDGNWYDGEDEKKPVPVELVEFVGCNSASGMRSSDSGFTAICKTEDGRTLVYVFCEYWESDSWAGPGDCGAEVEIFDVPTVTDDEIKYFVDNFSEYGRPYNDFVKDDATRQKIADLRERGLVSTAYSRIKLTELGRHSTGLQWDELFPANLRPRLGQKRD